MLPLFRVRSPNGYGLITTVGRQTGKRRRKCVRVIQRGSTAFLVQLRPPEEALANPSAVAAWVWNLRAKPSATIRLGTRNVSATVREVVDPRQRDEARRAFVETVHLFDYGECAVHLRGLPTRRKIRELHEYWFDTGVPLIAELEG
jgi:deazaflavin-dependent oxidoreductase (nitroreductase family)